MRTFRNSLAAALLVILLTPAGVASAYNQRPKLVVVIVVDQMRGDYLERWRDQFGEGGFRMLMEKGAWFTDSHYEYVNLHTAPGHASIATGAYTNGHGIIGNEWYDPVRKREVTSVEDENFKIIGVESRAAGVSPRNLFSTTLEDELRMATQGKSRAFAISFKDRCAAIPAGRAGTPYWINRADGKFVSSSFYMSALPAWVANFNKKVDSYWNREWKDATGKVIGDTKPYNKKDGTPETFYEIVGSTPYSTDYLLDFARELITNEKLGSGPATDMLFISVSGTDILGHKIGPDDPKLQAMYVALDKQLAAFFGDLGKQFGLANVWIALSADHGIPPMPKVAREYRFNSGDFSGKKLAADLSAEISAKTGKPGEYVKLVKWTNLYLSEEAFAAAGMNEAQAEQAAGEAALKIAKIPGYYTRWQIANGQMPPNGVSTKYANSITTNGGWFTIAVPNLFDSAAVGQTDHASLYSYDAHVPLLFYGLPFQPGTYRTHAEPVDLAVTLASLLGINKPSHAVGRVLTEALPAPKFDNRATIAAEAAGNK